MRRRRDLSPLTDAGLSSYDVGPSHGEGGRKEPKKSEKLDYLPGKEKT